MVGALELDASIKSQKIEDLMVQLDTIRTTNEVLLLPQQQQQQLLLLPILIIFY